MCELRARAPVLNTALLAAPQRETYEAETLLSLYLQTCKAERFCRKGEHELTSRRPTYSLDPPTTASRSKLLIVESISRGGGRYDGFWCWGGGLADGEGAGPSCGHAGGSPRAPSQFDRALAQLLTYMNTQVFRSCAGANERFCVHSIPFLQTPFPR